MVKAMILAVSALALFSCQKGKDMKYQVVEIRNPDRNQTLSGIHSKAEPGVISGQVLNLTDDSAIAGAVVTIMRGSRVITTAITDQQGFFKVVGLPQSNYRVTAEKDDFSVLTFESVKLLPGKEVVTHFILTPIIEKGGRFVG